MLVVGLELFERRKIQLQRSYEMEKKANTKGKLEILQKTERLGIQR